MKKKQDYSSLTARERKMLRSVGKDKKTSTAGSVVKKKGKVTVQSSAPTDPAEAMLASQKRSKRSALIMGGVVALAILMIVVALIVPVILHLVNPYRGYDDVIARFELSNGMTLEYVIEEDKYDTAATNFIFLAKNGYFDNTVFYDAQGGWLRFGGYEEQPRDGSTSSSDYNRTRHHGQNESYCKGFSAIPSNRFSRVTYKFGYRLRSDEGGTNENVLNSLGVLTYRYDNTATEFQFNYDPENTDNIPNKIAEIKSTRVGRPLNDETVKNLQAIAKSAALNPNIGETAEYQWKPPTPDIRIVSVDVYNLDSEKWDEFDFLNYIHGNDASGRRRMSSWVGLN